MWQYPVTTNIQKKTTEKRTKYGDLQIECQRMWDKTIGNTNHHRNNRSSREEPKAGLQWNTRMLQCLQSTEVSHPRNCPGPQEGTIHQARLDSIKNYQPCES